MTNKVVLFTLVFELVSPGIAKASGLLNQVKLHPSLQSPSIVDINKLGTGGRGSFQDFRHFERRQQLTNPSWIHRHSHNGGDATVSVFDSTLVGNKHGGLIQQIDVNPAHGMVQRFAIQVHPTDAKPTSVKLHKAERAIDGSRSPVIGVTRTYDSPTGKVELSQDYTTMLIDGKPVGVQTSMTMKKGELQLHASRSNEVSPRELVVQVKSGGKELPSNGHFKLPADIPGEIVGFQMSASGSRFTVFTSEGRELHYLLGSEPNAFPHFKTLTFKLADDKIFDLKTVKAEFKTYRGRAAASGSAPNGLKTTNGQQ